MEAAASSSWRPPHHRPGGRHIIIFRPLPLKPALEKLLLHVVLEAAASSFWRLPHHRSRGRHIIVLEAATSFCYMPDRLLPPRQRRSYSCAKEAPTVTPKRLLLPRRRGFNTSSSFCGRRRYHRNCPWRGCFFPSFWRRPSHRYCFSLFHNFHGNKRRIIFLL